MASSKSIQMRVVPLFFHNLSAMLVAGIPLETALMHQESRNSKSAFGGVVRGLRDSAQRGNPLSAAMQASPEIFLPMHTGIIQAAETAGRLPETLEQVAKSIDDQLRLKRKLLRAMLYPMIVLCIALIIVTVMLVFVLPIFAGMYEGYDAKLPGPTLFLLGIRTVFTKYGLWVLLGVVAFIFVSKLWKMTLLGRVVADWLKLHCPIAGDLNRKVATARFARTYAQLLGNGAPIITALKLSAGAMNNNITEQVILNAIPTVERGDPLSDAMQEQRIFPDILVEMLRTGEQTGKTDELLDNLASLYEEEVSVTVDGLTMVIQPLLIVVLGIIVGGMLIGILMPWFRMPSIVI